MSKTLKNKKSQVRSKTLIDLNEGVRELNTTLPHVKKLVGKDKPFQLSLF